MGKGYWWNGDQFVNGEKYAGDEIQFYTKLKFTLDQDGKAIFDINEFPDGADALQHSGFFSVNATVVDAAKKEYKASERLANNLQVEKLSCWADSAFFEPTNPITLRAAAEKEGKLGLQLTKISGTNRIDILEKTFENGLVELDTLASGLYEAKARNTDGQESTPFSFFVLGKSDTELTAENPIRIIREKGLYSANETATVLVQVDQPGRQVYFFERVPGHNAYSMPRTILMDQTSKRISFPLKGDAGKIQCAVMTIVDGKKHLRGCRVFAVEDSKIAGTLRVIPQNNAMNPAKL